ncbi:sulfatase-like hydrolase/transferase [Halovenus amylolytica]|uniref:sulfatase-like hydrolase/transferase n=1 Tax=Halovenus amylolytica TaxID=2500550 RepID=UPI00360C78F7
MSSIAVVVLDTLRKDYFDEYFDWVPGRSFEAAYSTANWTGPAHASLFTGKYGSAVDVSSKATALECDRPVLAEILSEAGYTTKGWSANPNASQTQNFDRGFEEFTGPGELRSGDLNILDTSEFAAEHDELSRPRKYTRALNEIITGEYDTLPSLWYGLKKINGSRWRPIPDDGASVVEDRTADMSVDSDEFLFVNLVEAHTPYYPPEAYRDFDEPVGMGFGDAYVGVDDPELVREAYDNAARYLGDIYRDIFDNLSAKFDYVITLSDHGELLGEHHNMWNHVSGVYPELTHIPLVISGDGFEGETDTVVSILDLYETILELADVDGPVSDGHSIVSPTTDHAPYLAEYRGPFNHSLEQSKKYDFDLEPYDSDLFALIEPDYYGYEDYDGWKEIGEPRRDEPRSFLRERITEYGMDSTEHKSVELTDSAESRLEELGYI